MNGNHSSNGSKSRWWSSLLGRHRNGADEAAYRRLSLQLHYDLPRGEAPRSALLVTPRVSSSGAYASMNLAMSLAEQLRRNVLLIDASPSRPDLTRLLGCDSEMESPATGAAAARSIEERMLPTSRENVMFVPAGVIAEYAKAGVDEALRPFIREAEQRGDFILVFGGSVYDEPLVRALASQVGCVLLTAVENETRTDELETARDTLTASRARRIELLLTTAGHKGVRLSKSSLSIFANSPPEGP